MLVFLVACATQPQIQADPPSNSPPVWSVELIGPDAFDPLLTSALHTEIATTGSADAVRFEILDLDGAVLATPADGTTLPAAVDWDGTDSAGTPLPVGDYRERATLLADGEEIAWAERDLHIVRVGLLSGTLGGAGRIPLLWHAAGGNGLYWSDDGNTPTFTLAALDEAGAALPIPDPWADLDQPPETPVGVNLPAAFAFDSFPSFTLVRGGEVAGAEVRVDIEGWTCVPDDGPTTTCLSDARLSPRVGVVEDTLTARWSTPAGVFATQAIPVRMYALLDTPGFESSGVPYQPWVGVIDPALRHLQDHTVPAEADAVTDAIVDYVFHELGLAYDTQYGASSYVQYDRGSYNDATLNLSAFLTRANGDIVNCTDCAALVEAIANMLGAPLSYAIIVQNFDLNYIEAIGYDSFTHCPFGDRGCGFRYHAVTTPDDATTIYDATLALDGDDDPSASPSTELLVQSIPGDEYLNRLVMSGAARYDFVQQGFIR